MKKRCVKIKVKGHVQGVSYRAFVKKYATELGVEGTVRNLDDGSVLIHACADGEKLEELIDLLYQGPQGVVIDSIETSSLLLQDKDFRGAFRVIGD